MISDYGDVVVKKPWGEEYLCYRNGEVAIWFLYIKAGEKTSMHCHPTKNTGLVVLKGSLELSFIRNTISLEGLDKIHIFRSRFHSSHAKTDSFLFEVEVLRIRKILSDWTTNTVGRTGYEGKEFLVIKQKTIWLPDPSKGNEIRLHGCFLRHEELTSKVDLYGLSEEDVVVFTSGGIVATGNKKILYPGDIADGATLGKIVPKFEVRQTSVSKNKRLRTRNNHGNDILFVHPNASKLSQDLAKNSARTSNLGRYASEQCRGNGFSPEILDAEVLGLNYENWACSPGFMVRVICFVVYGQQRVPLLKIWKGQSLLLNSLKSSSNEFIVFVMDMLCLTPRDLEKESCIDAVCQNEGVYTLRDLLVPKV